MSAAPNPDVHKRTLLQRLFRCGLGQNLISVWVDVKGEYAHGQTITETRVKLGRYTVARWTTVRTPDIS